MSTPAIRALKESGPGRRITLLTSSRGTEVARLVPEVDHVIRYDPPWMKATAPRVDSGPEHAMIERLRGFDASVIFTVYSQSPLPAALLCHLADIPLRLAHSRENPYQLLTDWVPDPEPEHLVRHEVRRQLDLVSTVGAGVEDERLSLQVPDAAHEKVARLVQEIGLEVDRPWVVVHPGATAPSRRYPWEHFVQVAGGLGGELGCQVVFTGTEPERELVEQIRSLVEGPTFSLVGRLDLAELAALLSVAPLMVSNNTGPAHVAAAVGTAVVDLYALTNPQHTPWMVRHRVLSHDVPCRNCYSSVCREGHHDCLRLVRPQQVVEAAAELLGEPEVFQPA
ncbi:MAG: lipopolysaccharide heptosyltransferase II [Actinomycetota bacterium]|nr:lipopolysaccharide heptosyltransferase II [Actinomycetota bacterium]